MAMTSSERDALIRRYAEGPARLKAALATVPAEALKWRPEPKEWSAHEIICHCADSETNAYARIRYVIAEQEPTIQGYDQDRWALAFDYHASPLEPALAVVEAVRANTVQRSAIPPFVIQIFSPFRLQLPSSLRFAAVRIEAASEPAPDSVRQNAAINSPVASRGR